MKYLLIVLLSSFITLASASSVVVDEFIPEASGVCRMDEMLVIGGDEEPSSLWVLSTKLEKLKVNGDWDDLEGLATANTTQFFAITSHSRTKKGKRKPEREQLMLMNLSGKKIEMQQSWSLREQILAQLEKSHGRELDMKQVEAGSPDDGGLNIEGLALNAGHLYLGLRSPVTSKGEALIVVIQNAEALLTGAAPVFGEVITARLGGNGIRSLDSKGAGLLVLSGSTDDTDKEFGLDHLVLGTRAVQNFEVLGFEDLLRPEGVVAEKDGSVTLVQDFKEPQAQDIIVRLR